MVFGTNLGYFQLVLNQQVLIFWKEKYIEAYSIYR